MTMIILSPRVSRLLDCFGDLAPAFSKEVNAALRWNTELFIQLAEPIIAGAEACLGSDWDKILVRGYVTFVSDVNKSQLRYEKEGRYPNSSFAQAFTHVYDNPEFMRRYHWGVMVTSFAWRHHLRLYNWFREYFLPALPDEGRMVDLGAGSGIWHTMVLLQKPELHAVSVDVSAYSVDMARQMASHTGIADRVEHRLGDALGYRTDQQFAAGLSCFLLEHLEQPRLLLDSLAANLRPGAPAFVTAALTAAEIDHISEFRRESELVSMAEAAGFRVVASLSASPDRHLPGIRFLPRSMGMVLQRRQSDYW